MALQQRKVELPLFGGLSQEISPEVVESPNMLTMQDVRYDKEGRARRRWGYIGLNPAKSPSGNMSNVVRMLKRDDTELIACDDTHMYSRTAEQTNGDGVWQLMDRMPPIVGLERKVIAAEYGLSDVFNTSVAYSDSGYIGVSYELDNNGVSSCGAFILDQERGQVVASIDNLEPGPAAFPRIIATTAEIIALWRNSNNVRARRFDIATLTWGSPTTLVSDALAGNNYDVHVLPGQSFFFVANIRTGGGSQLDVRKFNSGSLTGTGDTALDARGGAKVIQLPSITVNAPVVFVSFYNDTDDTIECLGRSSSDLSSTFAASALKTGVTLSPVNITSAPRDTGIWVAWDFNQVGTPPTAVQRLEWRGISAAGSVDGNGPWKLQNYILLSRPLRLGDNRSYLVAGIRSNQQAQFGCVLVDIGDSSNPWVTDADNQLTYRGRPCGKWMTGDLNQHGIGVLTNLVQGPTSFNEVGIGVNTNLYAAFGKKDITVSGFGRGSAAELTTLAASNLYRWSADAQIGSDLYIPGALPHIYDGDKVFEAGFCYYPWAETTSLSAGGTLVVDSLYEYKFVYEFIDRQGRIWRSQPSFVGPTATGSPGETGVGSAVTNTTGNLRTISIRVPHYSLTSIRDVEKNYRNISIVAYRRQVTGTGNTGPDGAFIRLMKSGNVFDFNDTFAGTYLLFTDNGSSYSTLNQPPLYTDANGAHAADGSGLIQENFPPRPSVHACIYDGRVFQACTDEPRVVRFSAELLDFEGARWHEDNFITTPDDGAIMAVIPLNAYLIIFKRRAIYWMQGNGPDDTGLNGSYTPPQKVATTSGCINTRSLVLSPNGIYFQSERGFELLDPSLRTSLVGKVEDIVADNLLINSAEVDIVDSEVRWTTIFTTQSGSEDPPKGGIIKYNYEFDRWSFDKAFEDDLFPTTAVYVNGRYYFGAFGGTTAVEDRSEDDNTFSDRLWLSAASFINYTIKTPNIKLDSLQGFCRLWRITLMGKMLYDDPLDSPGVNVTLSSDYTDNLDFTVSYPLIDIVNQGNPPIVQLRIIPKQQQLSSVAVTIKETIPSGTSSNQHNAGIAWTSVMLEYGIEPKPHGRFKGAANK